MGGRAGGGASGGMGSRSRSMASAVAEAEKELGFSLSGMSKEEKASYIEEAKQIKAWKKDFADRTGQPRTPIEKGSAGYKEAQKMANQVFNSADETGRMMSFGSSNWDMAAERVKFATDFVSKNGNAFEKSVAESIAKTIRPYGKGRRVAFVSKKQAWVIGKALSEMHVKSGDFPWS